MSDVITIGIAGGTGAARPPSRGASSTNSAAM